MEVILSNPYVQYIESCRRLCDFLQFHQELPVIAYRKRLLLLLLETYQVGLVLPELIVNVEEDTDDNEFQTKLESYHLAYADEIGDIDYYFDTFNPLDLVHEEIVAGSVLDELNEIFRQLKGVILMIDAKDSKWLNEAIWQMQFDLELSVLNAIVDLVRIVNYSLRPSYQ